MSGDGTVWFLTAGVGKVVDHTANIWEIGVHWTSVHTLIVASEGVGTSAGKVAAIFPSLSSMVLYSLVGAHAWCSNHLSLVGLWWDGVGFWIVGVDWGTVGDSAAGGVPRVSDVVTPWLSIQNLWTSAQASVDALFSILTGTFVAAAIVPGLPLLVLFAIVHTEISLYGGCGSFSLNLWIVGDEFTLRNLAARVLWVLCKPTVGLWHIVKSSALVDTFVVSAESIITDAIVVASILPCLSGVISLVLVHTETLSDISWGCWCNWLHSGGVENDPGSIGVHGGVQCWDRGLYDSNVRSSLVIRRHWNWDLACCDIKSTFGDHTAGVVGVCDHDTC